MKNFAAMLSLYGLIHMCVCVCGFFAQSYPFIHRSFFFLCHEAPQSRHLISYEFCVCDSFSMNLLFFHSICKTFRAKEKSLKKENEQEKKKKKRTRMRWFFVMSRFRMLQRFIWAKKATLAKLINVRQAALWASEPFSQSERSFTLSKYLIAWAWCNLFFIPLISLRFNKCQKTNKKMWQRKKRHDDSKNIVYLLTKHSWIIIFIIKNHLWWNEIVESCSG